MRLAVLADIHGNLPALEAVLEDIQSCHVEGMLVAGDLVTGGPFPLETLHLLRSQDARMIRGNTDNYLLDYRMGRGPAAWRTAAQWAPMRWTYAQLDAESLDFLAALPEQQVVIPPGTMPIRFVHGSLTQVNGVLVPDQDTRTVRKFKDACLLPEDAEPPSLRDDLAHLEETVLVCGHTHIAWQARHNGGLALNPGSAGMAIDGNMGVEYALLTWEHNSWHVDLRCIPYDLDRLRVAFYERGALEAGGLMAHAFLRNAETGQNFAWFLIQHAAALAEAVGLKNPDAFPDDLWERAGATFDWKYSS
ncbi:MAG: metallophosphoesterase family protein [Anaerolineae bacterium]|nr:metallophosphoesterase family protein [Anaerolineae bacterium]